MPRRRLLFIAIVLCLIALFGVRVYVVNNSNIKFPIRQIYQKGQIVPYGKDYISTPSQGEGYTVQVQASKVMAAADFCRKYGVKDIGIIKYYYMVKLSVKNIGEKQDTKHGAALGNAVLLGRNYYAVPMPDTFQAVNPKMPGASFSLYPGKKKELWLVFQMVPGQMPDYKDLKKDPPMLQITEYPHQKLLKLS